MIELEKCHWSELKKMMEEKGQPYSGKAEAIKFLSGPREESTPIPELIAASTTLDRSRPFGQVIGTGDAAYEQDGILYDANGVRIDG